MPSDSNTNSFNRWLNPFQPQPGQRGLGQSVDVFRTARRGWGVRARTQIETGQFVCTYSGEILGQAECSARYLKNDAEMNDNYIIALREHTTTPPTATGAAAAEAASVPAAPAGPIPTTTFIDAGVHGNVGRYINHSCDPNLVMLLTRSDYPVPVAALYAAETIAAGAELTFSYGECPTSPLPRGIRECLCGADSCTGYLPFDAALGCT